MVDSRPNIWRLQSRRDIERLIAALSYPDADVRRRAVMALRSLDASQAVPALKAALLRETDAQVRVSLQVAIQALDEWTDIASLARAKDIHSLVQVLQGRNAEYAIAAAHALGELGDRMAVEPLVILFHNSALPPAVRLAAAEALLTLKSAPAVVTLLGALRRDAWQVRRNAAAVLGQIQATWAVDPLAAALDDSHPVVRRTAAAALRRIGTTEAIAVLRKRFGGQTPEQDAAALQRAASIARTNGNNAEPEPTRTPDLKTPPFGTKVVAPLKPEMAIMSTPATAARSLSETGPLAEPRRKAPQPAPEKAPAKAAPEPETDAEPSPEELTARLTRPVYKLIAFLRNRD